MLRVEGLTASYGLDSGPVVKSASIELGDGEVALVTGPSGSGKTTLVLAITGVLKHLLNGHVTGRVSLGGVDPLDPHGFRRVPLVTGVVLQDPDRQIAMPTPLDELVFTLENMGYETAVAVEKSKKVLEFFGLGAKASEHVENLSLGEKRRLTIASAVVHDPGLLILDEPTASLDPWGVKNVVNFVDKAKRMGLSVLLVEHKPLFFRDLADKTYRVERGVLVDSPPPPAGLSFRRSARSREGGESVLEAEDLVVGYGEPVLRADSIRVGRGEVVVVAGPNGSGKTTLLKTIAGFLKPLSYRKVKARRAFYVPQHPDFTFIHRTVEGELRDAARSVAFSELASMYPWFDQVRRRNPFTLSHGQRRWLANLVAYGYSRDLILLDEPSTGLDDAMFGELVRAVRALAERGAGLLVSTHDPRLLLELADRAYFVDGGRLREVDPVWLGLEMLRAAGVRLG
ncbi:MAG: ATP-binding cassette domain-containing protein [Thermogladius sp.]